MNKAKKLETNEVVNRTEDHSPALYIGVGAGVLLVAGIILWRSGVFRSTAESSEILHKASDTINDLEKMTESSVAVINRVPHTVSSYVRTLPEGWRPSAAKLASAAGAGFTLGPGQTWVDSYVTGSKAA